MNGFRADDEFFLMSSVMEGFLIFEYIIITKTNENKNKRPSWYPIKPTKIVMNDVVVKF